MGHLTLNTLHVACDMWHMVGGEHSLKMSAPQLLRFGIDSVLKMTQWMNHEGVYGTKGLLKTKYIS